MNQITIEQLETLMLLRLRDLGIGNYNGCIEDVDDKLIQWYLTIKNRKLK